MKTLRALVILSVTFATAMLLFSLSARAESVQVDACEDVTRWKAVGEPYGHVEISAGPYDAREGENCVRMTFPGAQISYVRFSPEIAWGDSDRLTFWLKAEGPRRNEHQLRVESDAEGGVFSINLFIDLDFDGWRRVRLAKDDFEFALRRYDELPDWSKITAFTFGQMGGEGMPTIYVDDVRYERAAVLPGPNIPDTIGVSNCDSVEDWEAAGVETSASAELKAEGEGALVVSYDGVTSGRVASDIGADRLGPNHALLFSLRGPGVGLKASLTLALTTRAGGRFMREVSIAGFEMREQLVFPGEFRKMPGRDGHVPQWEDISEVAFLVENADAGESGNIVVDNVRFERMASAKQREVPDERFWWWDGGFDPFCAMHAIYADWPHLNADERPAILKFSEFILAPLVPYTIYLYNDGTYARFRVTITDWETNVQKVLDVDAAGGQRVEVDLAAPAHAGTQIFNVECLSWGGVANTYQTGTMVLAKRLAEPSGMWGLHAYLGKSARAKPHLDTVLRMFQAAGVMVLRERILFNGDVDYLNSLLNGRQGQVLRRAGDLGMNIAMSLYMKAARHLWVEGGRYNVDGMRPDAEGEVVNTMAIIARTFDGLVDWWEIGNEPNEHPVGPYAEILAACHRGARQGDPDAKVMMGGSHVVDRWQYQIWEIERETGVPHQDALATHLYPDPSGVESSLRAWVASLGDALVEKGMVMTEGGWETFPYKTQALRRQGLLPEGYSGERVAQDWYLRYAPVLLGEHLRMGAKLHGVCFFIAGGIMGDWMWREGYNTADEMRNTGFFVGRWNRQSITMARPMVYGLNTIARLLTHEVELADVEVIYDKSVGKVEHYAFKRPGETIVPMWIGIGAGSRADSMKAMVEVPASAGLVLSADTDGNERVLTPDGGFVTVTVENGAPQYMRFLDGEREGDVFLWGMDALGDDFGIVAGTPSGELAIAEGVSRDRNLPVVSDVVPLPGRPMVLYSAAQNMVYIVGQSDADVELARATFRDRAGR